MSLAFMLSKWWMGVTFLMMDECDFYAFLMMDEWDFPNDGWVGLS